jgi:hypothetical protein
MVEVPGAIMKNSSQTHRMAQFCSNLLNRFPDTRTLPSDHQTLPNSLDL